MKFVLTFVYSLLMSSCVLGQWIELSNPVTYDASFLLTRNDKIYSAIGGRLFAGEEVSGKYSFYQIDYNTASLSCASSYGKYVIAGGTNGFAALYGDIGIGERLLIKNIGSGMINSIEIVGDKVLFGTGKGVITSDDVLNRLQKTTEGTPILKVNQVRFIDEKVYAASDSGLFISADTGVTWQLNGFYKKKVYAIENVGNVLYCGTSTGLYTYSQKDGLWTIDHFFGNNEIKKIFLDGEDVWVYSKNQLYRKDENDMWVPEYTGITGDVTSLARIGNTLFVSSILGIVYKKDDTSWNTASLYTPGANERIIASLASDGKNLLAGLEVGGIFLSGNLGGSWDMKAPAMDPGFSVFGLYMYNGHWFASTYVDVFRSDDLAASWKLADSELPENTIITSFSSKADTLLACTEKGLYYTLDLGETWLKLWPEAVKRIVSNSNGTMFIATSNGLLKSTFPYIDKELEGAANSINDLVQYGDTIYYSISQKYVFRSFDGGETWTELSKSQNPVNLSNLKIHKEYILATKEGVVYILHHGSDVWVPFQNNLPVNEVNSMIVINDEAYIYVKFYGLYKRSLSDYQSPASINDPYIKSNIFYPNPASEIIHLQNPQDIERLEIYDLTGKLLRDTKVDTSIDIADLEKGMYILQFIGKDQSVYPSRLLKK
ncbi:MAG: T9SS type A sorting domain-containing protein [Sporocytophaga sp.]|uniref:T9SS type A sorting domain-containing protein n=1 Tax=Sporocytophaga sp. TaxID=2231183 RepID=UPI001AFF035D|nr:T9SS type A sorting domain-containing protein [Sporocytophaga sp.]MBO9702149.1 T9SS type A sorting domain-containing protein [Sporocytophaga sp.]